MIFKLIATAASGLLTACSALPVKNSVGGNVENMTTIANAMPPYVIYSMGGLIVLLIAIIFLFIKSPLSR